MIDNLYLQNNYLDMGAVLKAPYPFIICVSARGGGKTYGTLKACVEQHRKFLYLRSTKTVLDVVTDIRYHPFKRIDEDNGWRIEPEYAKGLGSFIDRDTENLVGYAAALSTFSNIRSFDGSDIEVLIFDEFIPQENDIVRFNMFTALLHAIETIGRNREMEGRPPLKVILLSNSDLIYGDIVAGFDIGDDLVTMQEDGTEQLEKSADMLLLMPALEAFKNKKENTALYRVTAGTEFADVALHNKFKVHDRKRVKSRPLAEYKPIASLFGMVIYEHKSKYEYFITDKMSGSPRKYESTETDRRRFLNEHPEIWRAYQDRAVIFANIKVQTIYKRLFE